MLSDQETYKQSEKLHRYLTWKLQQTQHKNIFLSKAFSAAVSFNSESMLSLTIR